MPLKYARVAFGLRAGHSPCLKGTDFRGAHLKGKVLRRREAAFVLGLVQAKQYSQKLNRNRK